MSSPPKWHYTPPDLRKKDLAINDGVVTDGIVTVGFPLLEGPLAVDLGTYQRRSPVSNLPPIASAADKSTDVGRGRAYFDLGLRYMFGYQHEEATKCFLACLHYSPDCALAHGMVALCHSPNYNFKGYAYYDSTDRPEEEEEEDDDVIMGGVAHRQQMMIMEAVPEQYPGSARTLSEGDESMHGSSFGGGMGLFPSQQVADRHSRLAVEKVEELRKRLKPAGKTKRIGSRRGLSRRGSGARGRAAAAKAARSATASSSSSSSSSSSASSSAAGATHGQAMPPLSMISDVESQILSAIRTLTCHPGVDASLAEETVGRPYADAMRKVYSRYGPTDAEVSYFFAESLMVLNAWSLYEYPTGRALSADVEEIQTVLEESLRVHPEHSGLCHLYVHLCEMSAEPGKALDACRALRTRSPDAGHLIHMATHIDVLVGDYESCVKWNHVAIEADQKLMKASPDTAGTISFYFGYIVHNYHMLVYGAILGAMEQRAMEIAQKLNSYLTEDMFLENPDLAPYLESYAALEIHVLIRFGRWEEILRLVPPRNTQLMLYRSATIRYARALAYANLKDVESAKAEADLFDELRCNPEAEARILHNNTVADLMAVDAPMVRGEIAHHEGRHDDAFRLLREAVALQDGLNYDEPWGKMQPIRHAYGGLLLERGRWKEAEEVFRADLTFHPKNPWALTGLIQCLERRLDEEEDMVKGPNNRQQKRWQESIEKEMVRLQKLLDEQRKSEWADFNVTVACACCQESSCASFSGRRSCGKI